MVWLFINYIHKTLAKNSITFNIGFSPEAYRVIAGCFSFVLRICNFFCITVCKWYIMQEIVGRYAQWDCAMQNGWIILTCLVVLNNMCQRKTHRYGHRVECLLLLQIYGKEHRKCIAILATECRLSCTSVELRYVRGGSSSKICENLR